MVLIIKIEGWNFPCNDLQKWSTYLINEKKSCEVSSCRFICVPIPFWYSFFTSDGPGGRDLQNLLISGGQDIKSMKISHVRYQIIGYLVFRFHFDIPFLTSDDQGGCDLQNLLTSGGQNIKSQRVQVANGFILHFLHLYL